MKKISELLSENFHFLVVKFSVYFNRLVFVMMCKRNVDGITRNRNSRLIQQSHSVKIASF